MNSWGKSLGVLVLLSFIVIACEDEDNLLGFQSPDQNFKVVYQEFTLPTSTYQLDSLVTSNISNAAGRLLVGSFNDSRFGRGTAAAYLQYFPFAFPTIPETATFEKLTMALVFDYYHFGSDQASSQTYEVHVLSDSLVNSTTYYTRSSSAYLSEPLGTTTKAIDPVLFDGSFDANTDSNTGNDVADSLVFDLGASLGKPLFDAIRASDSVSIAHNRAFFRWRRNFKGLAIVSVGADKVIGLDPNHAKSNITLYYKDGATSKQIKLQIAPNSGLMTYSSVTIDKTGTPLGVINNYFEAIEPTDGQRYIQSGGGIVTKVDMKPVYDYFANIPVKSLNVAELSIVADEQKTAPLAFLLRAVRPDNRFMVGLKKGINDVYDSVVYSDPAFAIKHFIDPNSTPRADVAGDEGAAFTLSRRASTGKSTYKGYMTTFLQRELSLVDKDYLTQLSLIPTSPSFTKSLNGFYFHKDSVKLKVFYTTTTRPE